MSCTQLAQGEAGGYMKISASIQDMTGQGRDPCKTQGCIMSVVRNRLYLVRAWYTLAMLCHVAGTWNEQGNDCFSLASGIPMTLGSKVT
jgi:hypothetical protein